MNNALWIHRNGFILGLILAVLLRFSFPRPVRATVFCILSW